MKKKKYYEDIVCQTNCIEILEDQVVDDTPEFEEVTNQETMKGVDFMQVGNEANLLCSLNILIGFVHMQLLTL